MLLSVPDLVPKSDLIAVRRLLADATTENCTRAVEMVVAQLRRDPILELGVLPRRMVSVDAGGTDGAITIPAAVRERQSLIRIDAVVAVFISDPAEYEGGELAIDCGHGMEVVDQPAGGCVAFPGAARVAVTAVSRGERVSLLVGVESYVPELLRREVLYDVRTALEFAELLQQESRAVCELRSCSDDLMRMWLLT